MIKNITCIECPKSCALAVEVENGRVVNVSGHECPKGEQYAVAEVENPLRILTSTILAERLPLKMVPVRTDRPIPKAKLSEAMEEIKKIKIDRPLKIGDVIKGDFLGLGVNIITTRDIE